MSEEQKKLLETQLWNIANEFVAIPLLGHSQIHKISLIVPALF